MSAEQIRTPGVQPVPIGGDSPHAESVLGLSYASETTTFVPPGSVIFLLPVPSTYIVDYGTQPQTDPIEDFVHQLRRTARAHNYGEGPLSFGRIHHAAGDFAHSVSRFIGESTRTLTSLPEAVQGTSLSLATRLRDRLNIAPDIDAITGQGLTADGAVLPSRFAGLPERSRGIIRRVLAIKQDIEVGDEPNQTQGAHGTVLFDRRQPRSERAREVLHTVGDVGREVSTSLGFYLAKHPGEALYYDLSRRADRALLSALEAVGDEAGLIYLNWKLHPARNTAFVLSPALVISCGPFLQQVPPTPIPIGARQTDSLCPPSAAESQEIHTTQEQLNKRAAELGSLLGRPGAVDFQRQQDGSIVAFFKTVSEGPSGTGVMMNPGFRVTRESDGDGGSRTCYYLFDDVGDEFFWGERGAGSFDVFARQVSNPEVTPQPEATEPVAEPSQTASSEPPTQEPVATQTEENPTTPPNTQVPTEALPTTQPDTPVPLSPKPPTPDLKSPTPQPSTPELSPTPDAPTPQINTPVPPSPTEDVIEPSVTSEAPTPIPETQTPEATKTPRPEVTPHPYQVPHNIDYGELDSSLFNNGIEQQGFYVSSPPFQNEQSYAEIIDDPTGQFGGKVVHAVIKGPPAPHDVSRWGPAHRNYFNFDTVNKDLNGGYAVEFDHLVRPTKQEFVANGDARRPFNSVMSIGVIDNSNSNYPYRIVAGVDLVTDGPYPHLRPYAVYPDGISHIADFRGGQPEFHFDAKTKIRVELDKGESGQVIRVFQDGVFVGEMALKLPSSVELSQGNIRTPGGYAGAAVTDLESFSGPVKILR